MEGGYCIDCDILNSHWTPTGTTLQVLDLSAWEGINKFAIVIHGILSQEECERLITVSESASYEPAMINIGGRQHQVSEVRNNDRSIVNHPSIAEKIWQRVLSATHVASELLSGDMKQRNIFSELQHASFMATKNKHNDHSFIEFLHKMIPISLLQNDKEIDNFSDGQWHAVGLNERLRFLRYDPGTFFAPHLDGQYMRNGKDTGGVERKGELSLVTLQLYLNEGFTGGATRFLDHRDTDLSVDIIPRTGSVLLFQHDCYHEGALVEKGRKYAMRTDVMYTDKGPGNEYSLRPLNL